MGLFDDLRRAFSPFDPPDNEIRRQRIVEEKTQARAIDSFTTYPGLTEQLLAVQGLTSRPWRTPSIREALGVPAIFRAVALISNTTGSLAMEAYRKGVLLSDDDTPRLIKRPDPFRIPRDFYRDTAHDLATRGEFWWWIAARDTDDSPLSLIRVPPWEIKVEATSDRLRPKILWNNSEMRRADMRQGTFMLDETGYRGLGPLQLCGAAVSVAVESDQWAANFFSEDGGYPSLVIKSATQLGEDAEGVSEAETLRDQWMSKPHNTPRVIDPGIESVTEFGTNAQSAQMLDSREHNKGDAANMFGIPGELLEYGRPGSSLTYQNVAEVFTRFVKTPLAPDYLEPIEQHMSDLLSRSTVARFNVKGFMRADIKTRWEVYNLASTVLGQEAAAELARVGEGLAPGDVEFAPVPFSPPAAVPDELPVVTRMAELRCDGKRVMRGLLKPCGRLLSTTGSFSGMCPRCKKQHDIRPVEATVAPLLIARAMPVRAAHIVQPAPVEPDHLAEFRALMGSLPERIAAAMPAPEPPVVHVHPPVAMRTVIDRDPITRGVTGSHEEPV